MAESKKKQSVKKVSKKGSTVAKATSKGKKNSQATAVAQRTTMNLRTTGSRGKPAIVTGQGSSFVSYMPYMPGNHVRETMGTHPYTVAAASAPVPLAPSPVANSESKAGDISSSGGRDGTGGVHWVSPNLSDTTKARGIPVGVHFAPFRVHGSKADGAPMDISPKKAFAKYGGPDPWKEINSHTDAIRQVPLVEEPIGRVFPDAAGNKEPAPPEAHAPVAYGKLLAQAEAQAHARLLPPAMQGRAGARHLPRQLMANRPPVAAIPGVIDERMPLAPPLMPRMERPRLEIAEEDLRPGQRPRAAEAPLALDRMPHADREELAAAAAKADLAAHGLRTHARYERQELANAAEFDHAVQMGQQAAVRVAQQYTSEPIVLPNGTVM
jgi:hypothetical protein